MSPSRQPRRAPTLGALGGALLGTAWRTGRAGGARALEAAPLLRRQRLLAGVLGRAGLLLGLGLFRRLLGLGRRRLRLGLGLGGCTLGRLLGRVHLGFRGPFLLWLVVLLFFGHRRFSSFSRSMPRCRATVNRRATSRRAAPMRALFSSSPVAWRKRRLNASSRASRRRSTRSWSSSAWTSEALTRPLPHVARSSS